MKKDDLAQQVTDAIQRVPQFNEMIGFTMVAQGRYNEKRKVLIFPVYTDTDMEFDWVEFRKHYDVAQETDNLKRERAELTSTIREKKKELQQVEKAIKVLRSPDEQQ